MMLKRVFQLFIIAQKRCEALRILLQRHFLQIRQKSFFLDNFFEQAQAMWVLSELKRKQVKQVLSFILDSAHDCRVIVKRVFI